MRRFAIAALIVVAVSVAQATVEEQRARLPPAAECQSPVAGRWRALWYRDFDSEWYDYTLDIHEDPSDNSKLVGTLYADFWRGPADSTEPPVGPACTYHIKVKMDSVGTYQAGDITFGAREGFEVTDVVCGRFFGYNPDHFTGHFDPERQEFQSLNNDGGAAVNVPMVFRRIGCFENGRKQPADVAPPPFFPKHRSGC